MGDPLDFTDHFNGYANRPRPKHLLRFFSEAIQNRAKSEEKGYPVHDDVHHVAITNPGSRDEIVKKVSDEVLEKFQCRAQYEHWKKTQEQSIDGLDLSLVPFMNKAQVEDLKRQNVYTLEHLAELSDTTIQRLGMGVRELVRKAQEYLKSASDSARPMALAAENEALKLQVSALQNEIKDLNRRFEAATSTAPSAPPLNMQSIQDIINQAIAEKMKGNLQ